MKKIALLALVILAGASFSPAVAGKKDKKKKKAEPVVVETVVLSDKVDSLSYAMGIEATEGLIPYLQQQMYVDTAYMDKFIEGFQQAIRKDAETKPLTAYSAGVNIAQMVNNSMVGRATKSMEGIVDSISADMFCKGFIAALQKNNSFFNNTAASEFIANTRDEHTKKYIKENEDFLTANKLKNGVVTLPSGLQYRILREGNGPVATTNDEVEVKYEGRLINDTIFDSSYTRNPQTNKFRPNQVIKGWTEALTIMPEGSMWELYIPQNLAYGERQAGKIPPHSTLIFKVELIKVFKAEAVTEPAADTPKAKTPAVKAKIKK